MSREAVCAEAVYGVILDVYPKDIVALAEQEKTSRLDMSATLYFDGKHHLQLAVKRSAKSSLPKGTREAIPRVWYRQATLCTWR